MWLKSGLSYEECLERARKCRRRRRKSYRKIGQVALFGWRFRSLSALCRYYGIDKTAGIYDQWQQFVIGGGRPAYAVPSIMYRIARLRSWGDLDGWNRLLPEIEAKRPKYCLPINTRDEIDWSTVPDMELGEISAIDHDFHEEGRAT